MTLPTASEARTFGPVHHEHLDQIVPFLFATDFYLLLTF